MFRPDNKVYLKGEEKMTDQPKFKIGDKVKTGWLKYTTKILTVQYSKLAKKWFYSVKGISGFLNENEITKGE